MSVVHDIVELDVGPVTVEDRERNEEDGEIDMLEADVIRDEDDTDIGFEETCREVYFAMRVQYCRRELDMIECFRDNQFFINYNYNN